MKRLRSVKYLVIHHSESSGGSVEFIRHVHVHEFGWADIGYHYVIGNGVAWGGYPALADGTVAAGRDVQYQGAHCRGHNAESVGICLIGNLDSQRPTLTQRMALIGLLADLCHRYGLTADSIVGHRDLCSTVCPGRCVEIEKIRGQVRAVIASRSGVQ